MARVMRRAARCSRGSHAPGRGSCRVPSSTVRGSHFASMPMTFRDERTTTRCVAMSTSPSAGRTVHSEFSPGGLRLVASPRNGRVPCLSMLALVLSVGSGQLGQANAAEHIVPLFLSASHQERESFVRVINRVLCTCYACHRASCPDGRDAAAAGRLRGPQCRPRRSGYRGRAIYRRIPFRKIPKGRRGGHDAAGGRRVAGCLTVLSHG